jgi:hypothetical protein
MKGERRKQKGEGEREVERERRKSIAKRSFFRYYLLAKAEQ